MSCGVGKVCRPPFFEGPGVPVFGKGDASLFHSTITRGCDPFAFISPIAAWPPRISHPSRAQAPPTPARVGAYVLSPSCESGSDPPCSRRRRPATAGSSSGPAASGSIARGGSVRRCARGRSAMAHCRRQRVYPALLGNQGSALAALDSKSKDAHWFCRSLHV